MKQSVLLLLTFFCFFGYTQELYFPPTSGSTWETLPPESLNWCPEKIDLLNTFLDENNTKAFILLKDGKIVIESYFDEHTMSAPWYWASAGKTITAFMTGIAQQEGHLSIDEPTVNYLGVGWTSCLPAEELAITIENQLAMTSGLDDGVADPTCTSSNCLECLATPGTRWAYHNAPYTLLDQVIEDATASTLNNYTTQKLKTPTGMSGTFLAIENNNVFFSNARSMARFGLLMLNDGNWDGNQIMTDTNYFNQMVTPSQSLNEAYGYLWWLNGSATFMVPGIQTVFNGPLFPNAPEDTYAALGKDGQFLNVVPSQNMVWIRMGEDPSNLPVPFLLNDQIWTFINDLECELNTIEITKQTIQITPNPASKFISVKAIDEIKKIDVFSAQGQLIKSQTVNKNEFTLNLTFYASGLYFVKVHYTTGKTTVRKIVKE
ncbi:MAG: serine hydrolase [Flavobacteriaceae bacterium]|nr:serine hydrolase [Flavobacteriaceae bacterium]